MTSKSIHSNYHGDFKDAEKNFGGNQLVYIGWDYHLWSCSSKAFPLPPDMPMQVLRDEIYTEAFGQHPDFSKIDFDKAKWLLDGNKFEPQWDKSLKDNGVQHKSLIRLQTPDQPSTIGEGI